MEKRNFTRVEFSECVSVRHQNEVFFGGIENMSLQGLFIKTDREIPLNDSVEINVYHASNSSIELRANVVRHEETGIGIQIKRIDVSSFVHLRDAVATQCNDDNLLLRETYKMASCIDWPLLES